MVNKKKAAILGAVTALVIGGTMNSVSAANSSQAGSSTDPLVTKSYVDESISTLLTALNENNSDSQAVSASSSAAFVPVKVAKGQILIGGEGAEIILRSGSAVSFCSEQDGIIDVTSGTEYFNGTPLAANHMVIIPRADGRGATVTSNEAWFIVKGGYEIK